LIIAFGNTDETYGVSMSKNEKLNFKYMLGLIVCSYSGWVSGSFLGSITGGVIPQSVITAMGIALYAMFLAIIIPPAKKSLSISLVIAFAVILSCIFNFTPVLNQIGTGWIVIISGISASVFGALKFPVSDKEGNT
jgi:predicted branched-subunit amino acid permease